MSVLVGADTKVVVQGITGTAASHHTELMLAYGTAVVAGVRPGAAGREVHGVPVFDDVPDAVRETGANASILFVPAMAMKAAAREAIDAGIRLLVLVSEHVPLHDAMEIMARADRASADVVGPNTPGLIAPALRCKIGFVPSRYFTPGPVAVASRSGTLTYEIVSRLTKAGVGQSLCVGVGGDRIVGTSFAALARRLEGDAATRAFLVVGEVGGAMEEEVADLRRSGEITKPIVAYLAGRTAPEGKRMGHAGAIVAAGRGSIASKLEAFAAAGIPVASVPGEVTGLVEKALETA